MARGALTDRKAFRDALVAWFERWGKDYPWRRTRDPYAVLVSEVMLQQTQIATVLGKGYFVGFLRVFPDLEALASADDQTLLKAWEGLGYYRRARMLRETARAVIERHGGVFPRQLAALLALPGIGRYTAGAVRAFAFEEPGAVVDGNVARVLARLMDFAKPVDDSSGQRQLWEWAESLADPDRPRQYHSALMELGQTICRPTAPNCDECPVARFCRAKDPSKLPMKRSSPTITEVTEHALWCRDRAGRLLMQCEEGRRRTGMWKLPTRSAEEVAELPVLTSLRYAITRYRVDLHVHQGTANEPTGDAEQWVPVVELSRLPMPSPFRKVVERLLAKMRNQV